MSTKPEQRAADAITVVIPVFGPGPHLEEVIDALDRQLPTDCKIIVSHSGTGDPSPRFADISRVKVLHSDERLFAGAARNRGLAAATTEWVAFIDEDIVAAPHWWAELRKNIDLGAADCIIGAIGYRSSGGYWGVALWFTEFGSVHPYMPPRALTGGPSANMAVRRAAFIEAGAFPEDWRSSEELVAQARLLSSGGRMTFVPTVLGLHFNQRGARRVVAHSYLYGRFGARLRHAFPSLPGAVAVRHPVVSPGIWLARLVQISRRVLMSPNAPKAQFLLHLPAIAVCLLAWNLNFTREALKSRRSTAGRQVR